MTTSKASSARPPCAAGSVSGPMILANSTNDPGQPWVMSSGNAFGLLRPAVDEVDRQAVDRGRELLEPVQRALLRAPVEPVAPVRDQLLQIGDVGAVGPAVALQRLGTARVPQARLQVGEHRIRHADRERTDARCRQSPQAARRRPAGAAARRHARTNLPGRLSRHGCRHCKAMKTTDHRAVRHRAPDHPGRHALRRLRRARRRGVERRRARDHHRPDAAHAGARSPPRSAAAAR